ncbi:MAG: aldehyde dehydrogenase family protein [Deltaproteobacteria bacterium]|nr:aldehyde dehydrogenase family protein [Deltaproteobacteria bacterium]
MSQKSTHIENLVSLSSKQKNTNNEISTIYQKQSENRWAISQTTAAERIAKLKRMHQAIWKRRADIHTAIYNDFKKHSAETDLTEIFTTLSEIKHTIKHLKKWMQPKKVGTPLFLFGGSGHVRYEPKGLVLVLSPWNYPFQLSVVPVMTAIAAGNCVILKPSSKVPHTSRLLKDFFADLFLENEVAVFEGSSQVADNLLDLKFDHIFFTGSPFIGKKVMAKAAHHLTPVTLELGGKSPVIIDETANIQKAAQRIIWGKFINAGQTCIAPDYLLVHTSQKEKFIAEAKEIIAMRYGASADEQGRNPSYCRLVSEDSLSGIVKLISDSVKQGAKIECGGKTSEDKRFLTPTLLSNVTDDMPIMQDEIFGPVLPIVSYSNLDEVFNIIQRREKPLALYIFSENKNNIETILKNTTSGGTCINAVMLHLANNDLPFGGVGHSGMGNYHGFYGFKTCSHERAVFKQGAIDMVKKYYPPYTDKVKKFIEFSMRLFG